MTLPLFRRYQDLVALPVAGIADLPTPLEPLPGEHDPGSILVKRDDLTNAAYGGNKVRKLDFLLGRARADGCKAVITFGAYGSNHALATALHARALGLEPHVALSPQAPGPFAAATLLAHAGLATVLHPVEGWDGSREAVRVRRELRERDGVEPLVIPMGGTSPLGVIGYVSAAFELAEQVGDGGRPDFVYVAGGTLGTAVGLAIGFAALRWSTEVVAVRVTPGEVANDAFARDVADRTVALLRSLDASFPALDYSDLAFELRHDHFEPGYGVVTPRTTAAVDRAADGGLKLETTYTGKAFSALLDDLGTGALAGETVVFWDTYHSGPMPAPGDASTLPEVVRDYVAECERLFGPVERSE